MATALHILLVTACVVSLITQGFGQSHCDYAAWGSKDGVPIHMQTAPLAAGVRDWTIPIPPVEGCHVLNGVEAVTCDVDKTPQTYFVKNDELKVHRLGDLTGIGAVHITAHCT